MKVNFKELLKKEMSPKKEVIGKKAVGSMSSFVNLILLVMIVLLYTYGYYSIWDTYHIYQDADSAKYQVYKPVKDNSLPFNELIKINPDVFGWINIYGTNIDYPLVQATDNEKYVVTNSKGDYSLAGSIFLDFRNKKDFSDFNNIIYGHHMDQNVMFGEISKFAKEDYFNFHKYGNLYFDGKDHGLEFYAYLQVNAFDSLVYSPGIKGKESIEYYFDKIAEKALYFRDIKLKTTDHIVLLSTCTTDVTNGRGVLLARINDKTYKDTLKNNKSFIQTSGIDSFSLVIFLAEIPIWMWFMAFILWILFIVMTFRKVKNYYQRKQLNKGK